jgi:uncharacterized protein YfbU (UPF0304 family)
MSTTNGKELDLLDADAAFYKKYYKIIEKKYSKQKDFIESRMENIPNKKQAFIIDVMALMQQRNITPAKAFKAELNKQQFKDKADLMKDNLMQVLRKNKKLYDQFRYDIGGSMKNFKKENLSYIGNSAYQHINLNGSITYVRILNSPSIVEIWSEKNGKAIHKRNS